MRDIACLSPDGSNIAYQDGDSIWVVNVSTGESLEVAVGRMAAWLDADTLIVAPTRSGRVSRPYNRPTWLPSGAPGLPIVDIRRVRNEIRSERPNLRTSPVESDTKLVDSRPQAPPEVSEALVPPALLAVEMRSHPPHLVAVPH